MSPKALTAQGETVLSNQADINNMTIVCFAAAKPLHFQVRGDGNPPCNCRRQRHRVRKPVAASSVEPLFRVRNSIPAVILKGPDRFNFVNGMGTNAFASHFKEPIQTVFTTNVGRCKDLVTAVQHDESVLLLSSLAQGTLFEYLDRYIFPADEVEIEQSSVSHAIEAMTLQPESIQTPSELQLLPTTFGATIYNRDLSIATDDASSPISLEWVSQFGTLTHDDAHWESERIIRGIPKLGQDITEENNPLEAGLWHQVSFDKGCYIGQETIARLNTYNGVKRILCLMEFSDHVNIGDKIESSVGDRAAGFITSVSNESGSCRALGYIREKSGLTSAGSEVTVNGVKGITMESQFLRKGYESRSILTI